MKKMILILALLSSAANAQTWKYVTSGSSTKMFIDTSSVERSGSTVVFWRKVQYNITRFVGDARYNKKLIRQKADCLDQRSAILQSTAYLDGASVHSYQAPDEWEYAAPGTVMEAVIQAACAAK